MSNYFAVCVFLPYKQRARFILDFPWIIAPSMYEDMIMYMVWARIKEDEEEEELEEKEEEGEEKIVCT